MLIQIDTTSSVPVYAQIVEQVRRAVATGAMRPGDPLPSLRETALRLRVNPLTVTKAYKLLEQDGLIETRQGLGSFVSSNVEVPSRDFGKSAVSRSLDAVILEARQLGISEGEFRQLVDERIEASRDGQSPSGEEKDH